MNESLDTKIHNAEFNLTPSLSLIRVKNSYEFETVPLLKRPRNRILVFGIGYDDKLVIAFPFGTGFSYGAHEQCYFAVRQILGKNNLRALMHGIIYPEKTLIDQKAPHIISIFRKQPPPPPISFCPWEVGLIDPESILNKNNGYLIRCLLTTLEADRLNIISGSNSVYFENLTKRASAY